MFVEKLAIGQPTLRAGLSGVGSVYLVYVGSTVGFMCVLLFGLWTGGRPQAPAGPFEKLPLSPRIPPWLRSTPRSQLSGTQPRIDLLRQERSLPVA